MAPVGPRKPPERETDQGPQASHRHRHGWFSGRPCRAWGRCSRYEEGQHLIRGSNARRLDGAPEVLKSIAATYPLLRHIFADGGYDGPKHPGNRQLYEKRSRPDARARLSGNHANPKVATFCAALWLTFTLPLTPGSPPGLLASSWPACEDGSACAHPAPNVPQNRSCHEKRRSARGYAIIRDGTAIQRHLTFSWKIPKPHVGDRAPLTGIHMPVMSALIDRVRYSSTTCPVKKQRTNSGIPWIFYLSK